MATTVDRSNQVAAHGEFRASTAQAEPTAAFHTDGSNGWATPLFLPDAGHPYAEAATQTMDAASDYLTTVVAEAGAWPPAAAGTVVTEAAQRTAGIRGWLSTRGLDLIPASMALLLITSIIWGALLVPVPLAIGLIGFHVYWLHRSLKIAIFAIVGFFRIRRHSTIDWRAKYDARLAEGGADDLLAWDDVRHLIIIPTYLETVEKLRPTLQALAEQQEPDRLYVVLAMEERDAEGPEKAAILCEEFRGHFAALYATFHPGDLPGEVRGKSSNEAWASVVSKRLLIDERGLNIDYFTVTSCDADCIFPPTYFDCLTYKFATDPKRHRRFWQAPIFLYNNIWDVPAPLRVPTALGGLNHLSRLCQPFARIFPQSCYTLSFRLADEVGHWDVDIVPEDWHMFLKCFFLTQGEPTVEPIFLPVRNDGVRARGYFRTFRNHYDQARRHAWGCSDIPYALRQARAHPEVPLRRRLVRVGSLIQNHVLWSSQWFLVTVPGLLFVGLLLKAPGLPFSARVGGVVPGMPDWFEPLSRAALTPCILSLVVLVVLDTILRPKRPRTFGRHLYPVQFAQWLLMAPITLVFTALPALESQVRLALGKRLEYRVTEKA